MSADIHTFLANFAGGGARPNRYEVVLTFPAGVPNALPASVKAGFTCRAASIPASNMGVVGVPYKGRTIKVPGDKEWDDWTVQILIDNDFATRDVFERWHDLILGFDSNVASNGFVNPANAYARATVNQLDRYDAIIKTYVIDGMFPSQVGELSLAYDANDQIMEQSVTFAINGWSSDVTS